MLGVHCRGVERVHASQTRRAVVKRDEAARYAKIIVAATICLAPLGAADKIALAESYRRMRFSLRAATLTEVLMWDTITGLLHEALISRAEVDGVMMYSLTAEGDMWLVSRIEELGLPEAWFRRAMVQCGLPPDEIVTRMLSVGQALRTMATLSEGLDSDETYLGYVAWRMHWEPSRQWSIQELSKALDLDPDVVTTQVRAAVRMGWVDTHDGDTYSLNALGVAGAKRKMHAVMGMSATANHLLHTAGLSPLVRGAGSAPTDDETQAWKAVLAPDSPLIDQPDELREALRLGDMKTVDEFLLSLEDSADPASWDIIGNLALYAQVLYLEKWCEAHHSGDGTCCELVRVSRGALDKRINKGLYALLCLMTGLAKGFLPLAEFESAEALAHTHLPQSEAAALMARITHAKKSRTENEEE